MAQWCLCAQVPKLENRTKVLVLRHEFEAMKSTNTARVANLALARMEILDWSPRSPPDVGRWLASHPNTWLLFPGESSARSTAVQPEALLILDGTWRQAKKIFKTHPELWRLPKLSLPPQAGGASARRLREAPSDDALSTMEAISGALSLIESPDLGVALDRLHAVMVENVLRARGMAER